MKTTVPTMKSPTIPPRNVAELVHASPAILGVEDHLWAAWSCADDNRTLVVRHGPALTQDALKLQPRVVVATGSDPVVGLARLKGKVYVAWSFGDGAVNLAGSVNGKNWDPPILAPDIVAPGGVSLVQHGSRIYILFRDGRTGRAALSSWDGVAFAPITTLDVPTEAVPAAASVLDPLAEPALHVAVATTGDAIVASRCTNDEVADLPRGFRELAGVSGKSVSLAALNTGDQPEVALGILRRRESFIVWTRLAPEAPYLSFEREDALVSQGGDLPRLAVVDDELFLGWHDVDLQVTLANHVHACQLSPQDERVADNEPCDPQACPRDPRLACSTGRPAIQWVPATIENALKGDLVLSPADGSGVVGTLLGAVRPPQVYDHMGVMVEDRRVIRHCTESKDRLEDERYYTGSILGNPAPVDGLREDHVTYGWPGTITQTIEDAFYTGLRGRFNPEWAPEVLPNNPPPNDPDFLFVSPDERRSRFPEQWKHQMFVDPEQTHDGKTDRYEIQNLPAGYASRRSPEGNQQEELLGPIVVKPPSAAEVQFPWVRPILHRVADAAIGLRGHYRFYSYTHSAIATDGSHDPPPAGSAYWQDIKLGYVTPDDPLDVKVFNPVGVDWAVGTRPMVCSTFIWAAVRVAERLLGRAIVLEGPGEPLGNDGKPHRPPGAQDGLYAYTEPERIDSATALHGRLVAMVITTVLQQQTGIAGVVALYGAAMSGVAGHVATQAVNSFALDRADETNHRLWMNPGVGDAVGPDDILLQWDAPSGADAEGFRGLYGHSEPALLVDGAYRWAPTTLMTLAVGLAHVRAHVQFTDPTTGDIRVLPTIVRIGCRTGPADTNGNFHTLIGAAPTRLTACAWDERLGVWARYEGTRELKEGVDEFTIDLHAPPSWRRRILCLGETRMYHNPDVGPRVSETQPVTSSRVIAWDPDLVNADPPPPPSVWNYMTQTVFSGHSTKFGDHFVSYIVKVAAQPDNSVVVDGKCTFTIDGDVQHDQTRSFHQDIPADGSWSYMYEATHDAFLGSHDYGRVALTFRNEWAKY